MSTRRPTKTAPLALAVLATILVAGCASTSSDLAERSIGTTTTAARRPTRSAAAGQAAPHPFARAVVTTGDRAELLHVDPPIPIHDGLSGGTDATITVDPSIRYQTVDGVGAALTESTAQLLDARLGPDSRHELLEDLFGRDGAHIGVIRLPFSATDFSSTEYTYDDLPPGESDPSLAHVSIAHDERSLIPLLEEARSVNPDLEVIASEWSAPGWMKVGNRLTDDGLFGGHLRAGDEALLGRYLARAVQAYAADGIPIDAITIQNEPGYSPSDYPSMLVSADQETKVATALGRALDHAHLTTKILVHDHNWDTADRALEVLDDPKAAPYIAGTAFHCYRGDVTAQTTVHEAHPDQGIYLTECTGTFDGQSFAATFQRDVDELMIDAIRNWSKTILLWNLALDETGRPHRGGCFACRGVVTIDSHTGEITRNQEYYALAQFTSGVQAGARRIDSTEESRGVKSVAFLNPDGSRAIVLSNPTDVLAVTTVRDGHRSFSEEVPAGGVATITWR